MQSRPRAAIKRLADLLLEQPVEDYIRGLRAAGKSFRAISRDLFLATNGEVDVSDVSLRMWVRSSTDSGVGVAGRRGDAAPASDRGVAAASGPTPAPDQALLDDPVSSGEARGPAGVAAGRSANQQAGAA